MISPVGSDIQQESVGPKQSPSTGITRSGYLFKLGDGYMNRSWNSRYFVLRGSTLQYYTNSRDAKPREVIDMLHATVSWLGEYSDRNYCIHVDPIAHRSIQVSDDDVEEARRWFRWLQEAADPQGFVSHMNSHCGSPTASLHYSTPISTPFVFKPPSSLPLEYVEIATLLETLVNDSSSDWELSDVNDGVKMWTVPDNPNKKVFLLIAALVCSYIFNWVFLLIAAIIAWHYFGGPKVSGGYLKSEKCPYAAEWISDPTRYSVWLPGARIGPQWSISEQGAFISLSPNQGWCVVGSQIWFVSSQNPVPAMSALFGLKSVANAPALPAPVLPATRHYSKGGLCVPGFEQEMFKKNVKLSGTLKPLPVLSSFLSQLVPADLPTFLDALLRNAPLLGSVGWAKFHPKPSEACPEGFSLVEASRPSQGVHVSVLVSSENFSGSLCYEMKSSCVGELFFKISFSKSKISPVLILPDLCFAREGRVWWQGRAQIGATHFFIRPDGKIAGDIAGHWLERVFVGKQLVWTATTETTHHSSMGDASPARSSRSQHPLSSQDEEALEFISQLKLEVPEMIEKFPQRFQNEYIYRFAKARHFKLDEVRRMILAHIAWLEEHSVDKLLEFEYPELALVKAAFPHGYHGTDKFGRPIYISRLAKTNQDKMFQSTTWERFIKFWIQSYEDLIWHKMPICKAKGAQNPVVPGQPTPSSLCVVQTLSILDIKGIGISQLSAKVREFISVTSKLASENYPEILGTMYIVNSPGVFPMIWNGIKSMIDPGTRAKIHVLNVKQTKEKLLEVIDMDQLPFFLGGACKCAESASDDSDFGCLSSDKGPWQTPT